MQQQRGEIQGQSLARSQQTTSEIKTLSKVMYKVNLLKDYPLPDDNIILWAKTLNEIRPWVTPEHLNKTINAFLTGKLEWEKTEGLQNIIRGVQMVK